MPTDRERYEAYLGPNLSHHAAICRGEYCACCDALMPTPPWQRGYRLCRTCWPRTSEPFHTLHAALQWSPEDWSLCICWPTTIHTGPNVAVWLLLHDRAECVAVLDRYICCKAHRSRFDLESGQAGHTTINLFVTERRLAALARETLRDPRTAYEKRQDTRKR